MTAVASGAAEAVRPAAVQGLPTITLSATAEIGGRELDHEIAAILPQFLARQRWFAGKNVGIAKVSARSLGQLPRTDSLLTLVDVEARNGETQSYFLPLAVEWRQDNQGATSPYAIAEIRHGSRTALLLDAAVEPFFARDLMALMRTGGNAPLR